ncbi:MAG: ABC transporter permease [Saprospiraceae bacterium]|nr:ABC transporter permease [Saprospiraceae bacterium]
MVFFKCIQLSPGIGACILIFLFIADERSFDSMHEQADNIYRLDEIQSFPGTNTQKVALSMPGMGPALIRDYPEIRSYARFWGRGKRVYNHESKSLLVEQTAAVDSTFLELFEYKVIEGDPATALDEPFSIVLTQTVANSFFGSVDVIGKVLRRDTFDYQITGVIEDVPENSHLQFDALMSINSITRDEPDFNQQFGSNYLNTYLLMDPLVDIPALETKMPDFLLRCMPPDPGSSQNVNDNYKLFYQKLADVHLASMDIEHDYHNYRKFNGSYLSLFTLVALLILVIAAVNFMNLMTARASQRWREVGVRKTIGAHQHQMFTQFSLESALLGLFAFFTGLILAIACTPLVNHLLDRELSMGYFLDHPVILLMAFTGTILLSVLAGIYPSYYLSSFKIVKILRGGNDQSSKSIFRSSLVVLQFGLAIGMIICTFIVVQQLYFIKNKDIGLNKDHILLVDMNQDANSVFETLKSELKSSTLIKGVTASGQRLGNNFHQWGFKLRTDSIQGLTPSNVNVDFDYLDVYNMKLVQGRGFSKDRPLDNGYGFVINESFAKEIGLENPVGISAGHSWYPDDSLGKIIGVVKDFNFNSLHYKINTLSMVVHPDWGYDELSVKLDGSRVEAGIAEVERVWNSLVPNRPFQYSFFDEHFATHYRSVKQMESVFTIMAILAILIACLGLFGLAAITTEKKIKEIGIRKVLGASLANILYHLSRNFALLVVLAFLIFSPITYWFMHKRLENFAERINIRPEIFCLAFL